MSKISEMFERIGDDIARFKSRRSDHTKVANKLAGIIDKIGDVAKSDPKRIDDKKFREFKKAYDDLRNFHFQLKRGDFH